MQTTGRKIMAAVAVALLVVMAALVILKAGRESAAVAGAGQRDEIPQESEELRHLEREAREAGLPMTPERAREKMREAMAMPEVNLRAKLAGEILRDLCLAGHVEQAWKMVDPAKGRVRDLELMAFFRYAKLEPAELLEKAGALPDMAELRRALDGYLSGGTLDDVDGVMSQPGFADRLKELEAGYPPDMKPLVAELVRDRLRASRSDEERGAVARFARKMRELKAIDTSLWMEVMKVNDMRDAFERWEEVRAFTEAEGVLYEGNPHRSGMLMKLMTEDPPRAMDLLMPRDDRQGRADLVDAMRAWYSRDTPASSTWLEKHAAELNSGQRDAVHAALARDAAAAGDAAKAEEWAAKVEDPEIRKGLLLEK